MICNGCGAELPDLPENETGCGRCAGSCRKVHCPYCGYENPIVPNYLQRLQRQAGKDKA